VRVSTAAWCKEKTTGAWTDRQGKNYQRVDAIGKEKLSVRGCNGVRARGPWSWVVDLGVRGPWSWAVDLGVLVIIAMKKRSKDGFGSISPRSGGNIVAASFENTPCDTSSPADGPSSDVSTKEI